MVRAHDVLALTQNTANTEKGLLIQPESAQSGLTFHQLLMVPVMAPLGAPIKACWGRAKGVLPAKGHLGSGPRQTPGHGPISLYDVPCGLFVAVGRERLFVS